MKCISCNNDIFKKYADDSNLSLPVFCCKECGLLITGNSESEIVQKIKDLYKKKYCWSHLLQINENYTKLHKYGCYSVHVQQKS